MRRVRFGHANVARVLELQFDVRTRFFPRTPPSGWQDNADLLVPDFFDPNTDQWTGRPWSWTPASATTASARICHPWII